MSETHARHDRNSATADRMMVPLWAIFVGILAIQVLIVAVGFRFLG